MSVLTLSSRSVCMAISISRRLARSRTRCLRRLFYASGDSQSVPCLRSCTNPVNSTSKHLPRLEQRETHRSGIDSHGSRRVFGIDLWTPSRDMISVLLCSTFFHPYFVFRCLAIIRFERDSSEDESREKNFHRENSTFDRFSACLKLTWFYTSNRDENRLLIILHTKFRFSFFFLQFDLLLYWIVDVSLTQYPLLRSLKNTTDIPQYIFFF